MNALLKIDELNTGYGKQVVLKNISARLQPGELIILTGNNGSGKSTLLKTLLRIIDPLTGSIILNHKDLKTTSHKNWAKEISAVLSKTEHTPHIKVADLIRLNEFAGLIHSSKENKLFDQTVEWLNLQDKLNRFADELSDGQLQKVLIARALMQNTPLVLFDEPTSHLDFNSRIHMFDLLKNLSHKTGKSFIIATHEINLALQVADKLWMIRNRELIQGIPEEIAYLYDIYNQNSEENKKFTFTGGAYSILPDLNIEMRGDAEKVYWVKHFIERNAQKFTDVQKVDIQEHIKIFRNQNIEISANLSDFFQKYSS